MKTVACMIYVLAVLLVSGFARAATLSSLDFYSNDFQSHVKVTDITLINESLDLAISGLTPTPCYTTPSAVLVQDRSNPNVIIIRLLSPVPTRKCVEKLSEFQTTINLRQLTKALELPLERKNIYIVKTEAYPFAMKFSGQDLLD
ncbi:MAG: hypothetical protein AB7F86_11570 [Bdellovibrionales bacterium]